MRAQFIKSQVRGAGIVLERFVRALLVAVSLAASGGNCLPAQDVVQRGVLHGQDTPAWIREAIERDPTAFQLRRGWREQAERARVARVRMTLDGVDANGMAPHAAAARGAAVKGTMRIPVFPLLFRNSSAAPYPVRTLQDLLFDGQSGSVSLSQLYREMSSGVFSVIGTVYPWTRVSLDDTAYERNTNGGPPFIGQLIQEVLRQVDAFVDFRLYDRNGDGEVDVVSFVQPQNGGECPNSRNIWSHAWQYGSALGQQEAHAYRTNDGVVIRDYIIQPALECDGKSTVGVGVFAHELGHALGLPDLYATGTRPTNAGVGYWSLMGHGLENQPVSPAHLDAWSKSDLGWVSVSAAEPGAKTVRLRPIAAGGHAHRVDVVGSPGEYFLLENRQALGSELHLLHPGLIVWHVDSARIESTRNANTVQNSVAHRGITLIEADGRRDLDNPGARGDASDPFPGSRRVTSLTSRSSPRLANYAGSVAGIAINNIREVGRDIELGLEYPTGALANTEKGSVPVPPRANTAFGPPALLSFGDTVRSADLQWLRLNGFQVLSVFNAAKTVYARIPVDLKGALTALNPRIKALDVQMRK